MTVVSYILRPFLLRITQKKAFLEGHSSYQRGYMNGEAFRATRKTNQAMREYSAQVENGEIGNQLDILIEIFTEEMLILTTKKKIMSSNFNPNY